MEKTTLSRSDSLPLTLVEVREWLRIDIAAEDDTLAALILSARDAAEAITNRTIAETQIEYRFSSTTLLAIPSSPVLSIDSVQLEDADGNLTTLALGEGYTVRATDLGAIVRMLVLEGATAVIVTATLGYASADDIPRAMRHAMAVHVGSAYAGREGQDTAQTTFERLLAPYRLGLL